MCKHCGVNYPKTDEYYYRDYRTGGLRPYCKAYQKQYMTDYNNVMRKNAPKSHEWVVDIRQKLKQAPKQIPIKDSEYHKNIERTDTNPKFFYWLCKGLNLPFETCKTQN